ncbi:serine/threonine-protein kinase [Myxococcaceae bacterium GXIMD 01537]
MATANTCDTCGLAVPPEMSVCPRDGTVLLSRALAEPGHDELEATVPGVDAHALETTASTRDPLLGLRLGEYELRQRIGVGGMGLVYDGIQPLIGKRVAVKVLRPELAQAPEQVARLLAEARAVNAIRHRGIIDIFGFGQVPDGRQYIVMEFLDGTPLDAYLAEKRRLALPEALSILDEVLAALGAAHGAGVVHRDLKPSNIFLVRQPDGSRYVKLLDFGLAKQSQTPTGRTAQTRTDMVVGTPEYMAPEQARGQEVGPMTDLYAMGVVTFEMVTGQLPFTGTSPVDLLMKHVDARPPRPSEFVPELPPALDNFVLQMLTKDPETRPGSADALRQQLQRLRRGLAKGTRTAQRPAPAPAAAPALAPKPAAPVEDVDSRRPTTPVPAVPAVPAPPEPPPVAPGFFQQRPWALPVGIGLAVLLLGGGGYTVYRMTREPPAPPPQPFVVAPTPPVKQPEPAVATPEPPPKQPEPVVATPEPQPPPTQPPESPPTAVDPGPKQAGTVPAIAHTEPPVQPVTLRNNQRSEGFSPSQEALTARIQTLERDVEARVAAGLPMSPAARTTLERMRDEARVARDAKSRRELAEKISRWEKMFLKR